MRTKAQIWSLDIMAGMVLFLVGIIIFFTYSVNQSSQAEDNLGRLYYDGNIIADNLLSEGYPADWNTENIVTLGLTTSKKINQTKLENLYEIIYTQNNYTKTKNILNTEYEYYILLGENITINSNQIKGIGKPGTSPQNISAKNLIKITRYTIYQNKTTPLYLYIWQE
ncbi:MAG: hypothetical protein V1888_02180 [archaeon]